ELLQPLQIVGLVFLGEFDDQNRVGFAADRSPNDALEHHDLAAEGDHGAIDQLHSDWAQPHQMLGGIHRLVETAEVADAEHLVAGHATDGSAGGGGDVDRKPQPVRLQLPIEVVEHDAWLDHASAVLRVKRNQAVEVFGNVDDDTVIDGLAALRRAAAARRDLSP